MRIQHNIMAMNSYRNFSNNTSKLSKNLEKLSSGYRINRAGDDAAGLAISEKMRAQISGLEQAQSNAKSGVNLVQTAEGALTEVHDMLNRMVTLSEQSANGTYDNETDRANLQKEFNQLRSEIDRIADSSNFNGINLLDGSLAKTTAEAAAPAMEMSTISGTAGVVTGQDFEDAKGAVTTFKTAGAGDLLSAAANIDAYKIDFTGADGKNYSLTLVESKVAGISADTAAGLAAALNGNGELQLASAGQGQDEALQAFRDTFNVTATTVGGDASVAFEVKDPASKGALTSVSHGTHASDGLAAMTAAATVASNSSTGAVAAGYELTLKAAPANGDAITIGDKTYQYVTNAATPTTIEGATAVVVDAGSGDYTNLIEALKADGYEVENTSAQTGANTIRFTDPSQLMEAQDGAQVETTAGNLRIDNQDAVKQYNKLDVAVGDGTAQNLTVSYLDAEGKSQTKTISYASNANQALNTAAVAGALLADKDLSELFDIVNNGNNTISITAKSTDTSVGQLTSFVDSGADAVLDAAVAVQGKDQGKTIDLKDAAKNMKAGDTITVNGKTYEFAKDSNSEIGEGNTRVVLGSTGDKSLENLSKKLTEDGIVNDYDAANGKIVLADKNNVVEPAEEGGLTLQIGDTSDSFNQLTVSIEDMHAASLGIADIDIGNQKGAQAAVKVIKDAINSVSSTRGTLGATQNRLDHTINNLSVMQENIQDAESTIRDVDVAKEMMDYTKNNILVQSAQAMLAQANQVPQGVLQLLQ